jgi:hypothetical protein
MAARAVKIRHDDQTRAKIQTSAIINRLQDCLSGKVELSATQVSAAKILLGKTLPDLQSVEHSGEQTVRIASPTPLTPEAWSAKHGGE